MSWFHISYDGVFLSLNQVFWVEIVLRMKMGFFDAKSGEMVVDSRRAVRHYTRLWRTFYADGGFLLDLIGVIPFHLVLRFAF